MANSTIVATYFESNHHYSECFDTNIDKYVRHNVDVYNEINGLYAVYQTAMSYIGNDYNRPSPELELSEEGGTHPALITLNSLTEKEIEELEGEDFQELLEDLVGDGLSVSSKQEVMEMYLALNDNLIDARRHFVGLGLSDNPDDYEMDPDTRLFTLKSDA